jgi:hypothetical protein
MQKFTPNDLVADEKYIAARLDELDWFNLMLFVLGNQARMAALHKLLKAQGRLPVPAAQITPFLATCGLDLRIMKLVFKPGWFQGLSADALANLYTFNEWVAERLDTHICQDMQHCVLYAYIGTDIRAIRHYLRMRSHFPIIDRSCELCRSTEAKAVTVLAALSDSMFDGFTVQEMRAIKYLLLGRPNQELAERLLRVIVNTVQ